LPLLIFGWLAYAAFAASLGLWCSIVSATKVQATMRALVICFALMLTSILLGKHFAMTTPMGSLWALAIGWREFAPTNRHSELGLAHPAELLPPVAGLFCYAAAAVILWLASCESFRKEMGPRPAAPVGGSSASDASGVRDATADLGATGGLSASGETACH
jgi:hypothetical protein